ncbi:MAG: peptidoglycan-associated lipoprotein Pal [Pseudomonadota bacterium]
MKVLLRATFVIAGIALSACTSAERFNNDGTGGAGTGTASGIAGGAQDPTSPLFFQQSIGDRVLFEVDQSTLTPDSQFVLNGQADWLNSNPEYTAILEGHADEQGTREYNLALGARRANAVLEHLVSKGVSADRMRVISYGKERPLEICSDETCYSKNRRAVTVLSAAPSS